MALHPITRVAFLFVSVAGMVAAAGLVYPVAAAQAQHLFMARPPLSSAVTARADGPCPSSSRPALHGRCHGPSEPWPGSVR